MVPHRRGLADVPEQNLGSVHERKSEAQNGCSTTRKIKKNKNYVETLYQEGVDG
jgi:hypothetical protein